MRVLLTTDGSDNAKAATEWLSACPLAPSVEILILAVAKIVQPVEIGMRPEFRQASFDEARTAAEEARAALTSRSSNVATRVLEGDPRDVIPLAAAEWNADLVVMGARGLSAVKRWWLGSVSTTVVHATQCPVLVVKKAARRLRKVVIAVDGSANSTAAVQFVARLLADPKLTVRLLAVVERPYAPRSVLLGSVATTVQAAIEDVVADRRAQLERALDTDAAAFDGKVATIERSIVVGSAVEAVLEEAGSAGVDLVVLGARGLGPIQRLLLGSVSERVLHQATCAVLIVKGSSA